MFGTVFKKKKPHSFPFTWYLVLSKYVAIAFLLKILGSRLLMVAANPTVFLFRAPYMLQVQNPQGSQSRCFSISMQGRHENNIKVYRS